jgi:hypothetical protein
MRLSAVDCYVILDALSHSLNVLNYGNTTKEAREKVLRKIESIMYHMNVEVITDTPEYTLDADAGI